MRSNLTVNIGSKLQRLVYQFCTTPTTFSRIINIKSSHTYHKKKYTRFHDINSSKDIASLDPEQMVSLLQTWDGEENLFQTVVKRLKQINFSEQYHYKIAIDSLWRAQNEGAIENLALVRLIADFHETCTEQNCHGFWLAQIIQRGSWVKSFWVLQSCWLLKTKEFDLQQLSKIAKFMSYFSNQQDLLVEQLIKQLLKIDVLPHQYNEALILVNLLKPLSETGLEFKQQLMERFNMSHFKEGQIIPFELWPILEQQGLLVQIKNMKTIENQQEMLQFKTVLGQVDFQSNEEIKYNVLQKLHNFQDTSIRIILDDKNDINQRLRANNRNLDWLDIQFLTLADPEKYQDLIIRSIGNQVQFPTQINDLLMASKLYRISQPHIQDILSKYLSPYSFLAKQ